MWTDPTWVSSTHRNSKTWKPKTSTEIFFSINRQFFFFDRKTAGILRRPPVSLVLMSNWSSLDSSHFCFQWNIVGLIFFLFFLPWKLRQTMMQACQAHWHSLSQSDNSPGWSHCRHWNHNRHHPRRLLLLVGVIPNENLSCWISIHSVTVSRCDGRHSNSARVNYQNQLTRVIQL